MVSLHMSDEDIHQLVDQLLVMSADLHESALSELASVGDERVIPHLIDIATIDRIANNWEEFGFPEIFQSEGPPKYLDLPETRWPGVIETLNAIGEPTFTGITDWLNWESWYSQQEIEPLEGYDEWKERLFWSYLPPAALFLQITPRAYELKRMRWGNTDRALLAALNAPDFAHHEEVPEYVTEEGDAIDYPGADATIFGFQANGQSYAVPRWVLFPHEMLNVELDGVAVSLSYCTVCNSPILFDRRVDGDVLTFGSTGLVNEANKVMFDEETHNLWNQQTGEPMAGEALERDVTLSALPVTQADWSTWVEDHPDTFVLDPETGHDLRYEYYRETIGATRHFWENPDVTGPGVKVEEGELPEKEYVYGIEDQSGTLHVYSIEDVRNSGFVLDDIDDQQAVILIGPGGDIAAYERPSTPLELEDDIVIDGEGTEWEINFNELLDSAGTTLPRLSGHHGLFFAFRSHFDDITVVSD